MTIVRCLMDWIQKFVFKENLVEQAQNAPMRNDLYDKLKIELELFRCRGYSWDEIKTMYTGQLMYRPGDAALFLKWIGEIMKEMP